MLLSAPVSTMNRRFAAEPIRAVIAVLVNSFCEERSVVDIRRWRRIRCSHDASAGRYLARTLRRAGRQ
jgi:hypothetical protein